MDNSSPVVVVGGGLAGCTAALALARAGARVTLVEAKRRLGGRVGSYSDLTTGQTVDYCQHVGMACCTSLRRLIEMLDQEHEWRVERELYVYGPDGRCQCLKGLPCLPPPLHLSNWLLRWPGLTLPDRISIARAMLALDRVKIAEHDWHRSPELTTDLQQLDQQSALAWLNAHGQSATALERFWSTIVVSALGEELSRVGLLAVAKVFQDGFLRQRDSFHLLIPQRPLDDLLGTRVEAALVASGVQVITGVSVQRLNWEGSFCRGVELADGRSLNAQEVISAVPWHGVWRLISDCPDAELRAIGDRAQRLLPSPISGVHTWWDCAWLPTPHAILVDGLCQWIFPHADDSARLDEKGLHYYQIVISASRMLPRGAPEQVALWIQSDLESIFPKVRTAKLTRLKVVTDPLAVFSIGPGTTALRPTVFSGSTNVYWAGDWVRTGWPATMEGAIRSGFAAAAAILGNR